ncbi:MAG: hypothetical protein IIZ64_08555 [Erysipelotrichaceae bacterium]|nr:hypothetical protein [Erysipelotrichaceae bacterium]
MTENRISKETWRIPVSDKDLDEYRRLIEFLKEKGYVIYHDLNRINDGDKIIAVNIDVLNKEVSQSNITCMAIWCNGTRYPLNVKEFIDNYHWLVEDPDIERYNAWVERKCQEKPERKQNKLTPILDNGKTRLTANQLKQAIDEECRKRGLPPMKWGNKKGIKVIVRIPLEKETENCQRNENDL